MTLQNTQFDAIMREYDRRQLDSRRALEERREEVYRRIPRIREIQDRIAAVGAESVRAVLGGERPAGDFREEIRLLGQERQRLLLAEGYPADYLEPKYACPVCRDTGFVEGGKCSCFHRTAARLLYEQSDLRRILKKENFHTFSFDYYSDTITDKDTGKTALQHARFAMGKSMEFVDHFQEKGGNLFFYGDTGVGKTFLSHCIAGELLRRGVGVLYFSAYDLFQILGRQTFSRTDGPDVFDMETVCQTDLLIIDDLGTELINAFVKSQLFAVLNERLIRGKSTIISTNFDIEAFSNAYTTRVFSRIMQNYTLLKLIGQDIRVQKTLGGNHHETE